MADNDSAENKDDAHKDDAHKDGAHKDGGAGKDGDDAKKSDDDKKKEQDERQQEQQRARARPFVRIALVVVILVLIGGGFYLWWSTRNIETTDDAYTSGRTVTIAPQVSGYVVELAVNDNQFVHQGQVLLRIDPRNYQAAVDQDQAQVAQAQGQLEGAKFQVEVSRKTFPAQLEQARAQVVQSEGQEYQAETEYHRQHAVARQATTQQAIDQATAQLEIARGQLGVAQAQVEQATPVGPNIEVQKSRTTQQAGALEIANAQLKQAQLNLGWTVIRAPHDGWIAERNVEQGNYVTPGQQLFTIVEPEIWITANFKETQLARMNASQLVDISVDAYPLLVLHGHVDSIQLGSGQQFSAFPPENATGNFVKIVQRVPVKILIDSGMNPDVPLPIGLSVEPTVHIGTQPSSTAAAH